MASNQCARATRALALGPAGIVAGLLAASGASALAPAAAPGAPRDLDILTINAPDAVIPGWGAYWVFTNPWVLIPLALSAPAPAGALALFESSYAPNLSQVSFPQGTTSGSDALGVSGTPVEFYPGWTGTWGYFRFQSGTAVGPGDPSTLYMVQVAPTPAPRGSECYLQFWCDLIHLLLGPDSPPLPACPGLPLRAGPGLDVLQRYRDEVLASSAHGQFYIDLYNQWSHDAILALAASPALAVRMLNASGDWLAGFQALVDGQGATFTVTPAMQASLSDILDRMQAAGSPGFASMLAFERGRLHADAMSGLTMTQLQDQIETLGGVSAVAPQSWGRTKSFYR
ncbi:MAG: hypothetical protein U0167_13685 [bacterium]